MLLFFLSVCFLSGLVWVPQLSEVGVTQCSGYPNICCVNLFNSLFIIFLFYFCLESEYKFTDSQSICPIWAKAGWCQKNSDLLQKCPHSCQKYGYMGANSMEERYITVNFQNTSSVTTPTFTEIAAPPPPSAAISAHSDLESVSNLSIVFL